MLLIVCALSLAQNNEPSITVTIKILGNPFFDALTRNELHNEQ